MRSSPFTGVRFDGSQKVLTRRTHLCADLWEQVRAFAGCKIALIGQTVRLRMNGLLVGIEPAVNFSFPLPNDCAVMFVNIREARNQLSVTVRSQRISKEVHARLKGSPQVCKRLEVFSLKCFINNAEDNQ